jgi:hypothetical protein
VVALTVEDPSDLDQVTGEIHDWYFDVQDVVFDQPLRRVTIPFRRWDADRARPISDASPSLLRRLWRFARGTQWEAPWQRWVLTVEEAVSCEVVDMAQVGSADFNEVRHDETAGLLEIEGNIPVTIKILVRRVNVSVEETREVIGTARYTTGPAGDWSSGRVWPLRPGQDGAP